MNLPLVRQPLPVAAPARVLACGAWLKNTACLLDGDTVWMSPLHGDLGTPEARAALLKQIPLASLGQPGDVAEAALFFASPAARYITGQVLAVDGGMVM